MVLPAAAQGGARGEVTVPQGSWTSRFRVLPGSSPTAAVDDQRPTASLSRELDFSNDTEVHVVCAPSRSEKRARYGGTVEFEADANRTSTPTRPGCSSAAAWRVRLGDEDGSLDNSVVGAPDCRRHGRHRRHGDRHARPGADVFLDNTDDATKIRYYTPSFGGVQLAVSYTPQQAELGSGGENGDTIAGVDVQAQDIVDAGVVYEGEFGGFGITASVVGITGDLQNVDVDDDGEDDDVFGDGSWYWLDGRPSTEIFGFKVAGSFADEKVGDTDRTFFTAGLGYEIGPVNTSVNWSQVTDSSGRFAGNGQEVGDRSTSSSPRPTPSPRA